MTITQPGRTVWEGRDASPLVVHGPLRLRAWGLSVGHHEASPEHSADPEIATDFLHRDENQGEGGYRLLRSLWT